MFDKSRRIVISAIIYGLLSVGCIVLSITGQTTMLIFALIFAFLFAFNLWQYFKYRNNTSKENANHIYSDNNRNNKRRLMSRSEQKEYDIAMKNKYDAILKELEEDDFDYGDDDE